MNRIVHIRIEVRNNIGTVLSSLERITIADSETDPFVVDTQLSNWLTETGKLVAIIVTSDAEDLVRAGMSTAA